MKDFKNKKDEELALNQTSQSKLFIPIAQMRKLRVRAMNLSRVTILVNVQLGCEPEVISPLSLCSSALSTLYSYICVSSKIVREGI